MKKVIVCDGCEKDAPPRSELGKSGWSTSPRNSPSGIPDELYCPTCIKRKNRGMPDRFTHNIIRLNCCGGAKAVLEDRNGVTIDEQSKHTDTCKLMKWFNKPLDNQT